MFFYIKRAIGIIVAVCLGLLAFSAPVRYVDSIPSSIEVHRGQGIQLIVPSPFTVNTTSQGLGAERVDIKLGRLPVKSAQLRVRTPKSVYVGGYSIGVALYMEGALVIGSNEIMTENGPYNPAKEAGIRTGDVIKAIDGIAVRDAQQLAKLVEKSGAKPLRITVDRKGKEHTLSLTPGCDTHTKTYKLGVWVRDSTAGVGTMTFVDPETGRFGALGHAICDNETGVILSVREGEIFDCSIADVKKGQKGTPGELQGMFGAGSDVLGTIDKNCHYGLFGSSNAIRKNPIYNKPIEIGSASTIHEGKATILCNVQGTEVKEYDVIIESVNRLSPGGLKGMVVRITDKELLDKTGGIVQGMSGSPIIQDGRLIGAVTHVFISDPTRGYGIFIENMLDAAG